MVQGFSAWSGAGQWHRTVPQLVGRSLLWRVLPAWSERTSADNLDRPPCLLDQSGTRTGIVDSLLGAHLATQPEVGVKELLRQGVLQDVDLVVHVEQDLGAAEGEELTELMGGIDTPLLAIFNPHVKPRAA